MGELVNLSLYRSIPDCARRSKTASEVMLEHILETGCTQQAGEAWVNFTLSDLWLRGFKVVPLDDDD